LYFASFAETLFSLEKTKIFDALLGRLGPFVGSFERSLVGLGGALFSLNHYFFMWRTRVEKWFDFQKIRRRP